MKRHKKVSFFSGSVTFSTESSFFFLPVLIMLSILLMGISAFKPSFFDSARSSTADFFSPVLLLVSLPFHQTAILLHGITGLAQLQADNSRLTQENIRLRDWYQTALLLDSENKSLRSLLNLEVDPKYNYISARVMADSGNKYVKSLLVSVGHKDGVEKGAAVLSGDGLAGRVVEVSDNTSRILLATDINLRVPVVVEDTGQHAIMAGTNGLHPILIHLPQDSEIAMGSRLITSGYGGVYPYNLPVGSVIENVDGVIKVNLFSDFNRMQFVRILQKEN